MKKWDVTFTFDKDNFHSIEIEGETYTEAYVNTMIKYPGAMITEICEVKNG